MTDIPGSGGLRCETCLFVCLESLLHPQCFGPEAKTRGGIIVSPAYTYKECVNIGVVCLQYAN